MGQDRSVNAERQKSATSIRWTLQRQGRVMEAEALCADDLWRLRLRVSGRAILQRRFVSLSCAHRYWRTIREALVHDGWR
jgi:hypothetical protein